MLGGDWDTIQYSSSSKEILVSTVVAFGDIPPVLKEGIGSSSRSRAVGETELG